MCCPLICVAVSSVKKVSLRETRRPVKLWYWSTTVLTRAGSLWHTQRYFGRTSSKILVSWAAQLTEPHDTNCKVFIWEKTPIVVDYTYSRMKAKSCIYLYEVHKYLYLPKPKSELVVSFMWHQSYQADLEAFLFLKSASRQRVASFKSWRSGEFTHCYYLLSWRGGKER